MLETAGSCLQEGSARHSHRMPCLYLPLCLLMLPLCLFMLPLGLLMLPLGLPAHTAPLPSLLPRTLPQGRWLLWGWLQERRKVGSYSYAGCLTLPRVLHCTEDGRLVQVRHSALAAAAAGVLTQIGREWVPPPPPPPGAQHRMQRVKPAAQTNLGAAWRTSGVQAALRCCRAAVLRGWCCGTPAGWWRTACMRTLRPLAACNNAWAPHSR